MSKHEGAHPRMGATDVIPFTPVSNVTIDECIEVAKEVGAKIGSWGDSSISIRRCSNNT